MTALLNANICLSLQEKTCSLRKLSYPSLDVASPLAVAISFCQVHIPTGSSPQKVDIHEPASLPWSQETHSRYPSSFKSSIRTLLLAHNRAWCQQPTPQVSDT